MIVALGQNETSRIHRLERTITQLGMGADPDDPVIDWPSLSWVVEDFHDCSGVPCLKRQSGRRHRVVIRGAFVRT